MANFTKLNNSKYILSNLDVQLNNINSLLAVDENGNLIGELPLNKNRNTLYRGKDLTSIYSIDTIYNRVSNGTFIDLFVGDYFKVGKYKLSIAGFDTYLNIGDASNLYNHHLILIIEEGLTTQYMNSTDITTGGYYSSYMNKTYYPSIYSELNPLLKNHIKTHREMLSNHINTNIISGGNSGWKGSSDSHEWYDTNLSLLSEIEVFGTTIWSSSGYDIGSAKQQLPYFSLNPNNINIRKSYWLSGVGSSNSFCCCLGYGGSGNMKASNKNLVRPKLIFG